MYTSDGNFGKVRLVSTIFPTAVLNNLACFSSFGWHRCNDRYRIKRTQGASDYIIFFTADGLGKLAVENKIYNLSKNTAAILPPYTPHEYYTAKDSIWEFYWINPSGSAAKSIVDFAMSFQKKSEDTTVISAPVLPYASIFENILNGFAKNNMDNITISANVSKLLYRLVSDSSRSDEKNNLISQKIIEYFETNYMHQIKLEDLKDICYFTVPHLIKRFKEETGYTPHEYLNRLRLIKAREHLLFNGTSVNEAARAAGFSQTSRFISIYKKQFGVTPGSDLRRAAIST